MTALEIRRRSAYDVASHYSPCDTPGCVAHSSPHQHHGRSTGLYQATICGHPAANLCERCRREWLKTWQEATT